MKQNFDVIILGAGSIGVPTALYCAEQSLKTLVIEQFASVGQGSNKHAIGGIRATHSDPAKISLCQQSLSVFSSWQQLHGDDIEWHQGGYSFVAYRDEEAETLKALTRQQQLFGLNINWLDAVELVKVLPDINQSGLLGGTYSPEDGSASPLKAIFAMYRVAKTRGVQFNFSETALKIIPENGKMVGVKTNRGTYYAPVVINACGAWSDHISQSLGISLPVKPDLHEAAITEPVKHLFNPMVVDMRPMPGSANFYFYQHSTGQIIFCLTPSPNIWGEANSSTAEFLPMAARRLIDLMPRLKHIRVRRTWRGTYPMTPDGSPIVGQAGDIGGYIVATGMCGQGFMLGPGIGKLIAHYLVNDLSKQDAIIMEKMKPSRDFNMVVEKLK